MTIHVLDRGRLTPQQLIAGLMNDVAEYKHLVVVGETTDGLIIAHWSDCKLSDVAMAGAMLQHHAASSAAKTMES